MIAINFDEAKFARLHYNNKEYAWAGYFHPALGQGEIVTAESHDKLPGQWLIEFGPDQLYRIDSCIEQYQRPKYFLCFYPGTQGRFLNQILRGIFEHNFNGITACRSGFNSWHSQRLSAINSVATHHYPNWAVVHSRNYLLQNKFVIIKFDYDDVAEIHANTIYKNIVQDLAVYPEQYSNFDLSQQHEIFQQLYGRCTVENFARIFTTDYDKLQTVIKYELDNYLLNIDQPGRMIKTEFITGTADHNETLVIDFKDLYRQTATGYIALDKICDFFKVPVVDDAVKLFRFNAVSRTNLIKKYFYKLDINC
jgi:hypothetical protein